MTGEGLGPGNTANTVGKKQTVEISAPKVIKELLLEEVATFSPLKCHIEPEDYIDLYFTAAPLTPEKTGQVARYLTPKLSGRKSM